MTSYTLVSIRTARDPPPTRTISRDNGGRHHARHQDPQVQPDITNAAKDLTNVAKDATYVAIGIGVIGVQKAQVQRQELQKRLSSRTPASPAT